MKYVEQTIEEPVAIENQLKRIADTLGIVIDALQVIGDKLEPLSRCVGYIPPAPHQKEGYHFFRIGGSVDTGNY